MPLLFPRESLESLNLESLVPIHLYNQNITKELENDNWFTINISFLSYIKEALNLQSNDTLYIVVSSMSYFLLDSIRLGFYPPILLTSSCEGC